MPMGQNGYNGSALIYCRISSKGKQEEGASLETQEEACRERATELGYDVAQVYHEVYTGSELFDRPALTELRQEVRTGRHQAVFVYVLDRITRAQGITAYLLYEFEKAGVDLISILDPLDKTAEGKLIIGIKEYVAEVEREKIRERTMRGKRHRVEMGKIHGSAVELYGYRRDKEAGIRLVYEPEAEIVRRIFRWFTEERVSLREVERRLNDSDVPPPSHGKVRYPDPDRLPRWGHSQLHRILTDPSYKGVGIAWRRRRGAKLRDESEHIHLPPGVVPAIVSVEIWDAAQIRLATNRGVTTRNRKRFFLLRGLVFCAVCGLPMHAEHDKGGRPIFRCPSRTRPTGPCGALSVAAGDVIDREHLNELRPRDQKGANYLPMDQDTRARVYAQARKVQGLDSWVWERVSAVLRDPSLIAAELERRRETGPDLGLVSDVDTAEKALERVEMQQARLMQRYSQATDEAFPWELFEAEIKRLEAEKQHLTATLAEARARLAQQEETTKHLEALTTYCERVGQNLESFGVEEKRLALEALEIRVIANGREWEIQGSIPVGEEAGVVSQTC